jgi:hypothetical protein
MSAQGGTPSWADALRSGAHATSQGELRLEHREIGRLRLPSGRIVAADPLVEPSLPPFTRHVPPGAYPVRLAIAHYPGDGDQRVAAAWLAFSEQPVVGWEPAQLEGLPPRRPGEPAAYAVDSATGSFLSQEGAAELARQLDDTLVEAVTEQMEVNYVPTWNWAMVRVDDELQVAVFSTGLGDGTYPSYWGLDAAGVPAVLLTDFGLLDPPEELRLRRGRPWWKFWSAG